MRDFVIIWPHCEREATTFVKLGAGVTASQAVEQWQRSIRKCWEGLRSDACTWQAHTGDWVSAMIASAKHPR
jgi:hypothetical protein